MISLLLKGHIEQRFRRLGLTFKPRKQFKETENYGIGRCMPIWYKHDYH